MENNLTPKQERLVAYLNKVLDELNLEMDKTTSCEQNNTLWDTVQAVLKRGEWW